MPLYFFHVHDGVLIRDQQGTELPDLIAVRRQAITYAGQLLCDDPDEFWNGEDWKVEVTDEAGLVLFVLQFSAIKSPALGG